MTLAFNHIFLKWYNLVPKTYVFLLSESCKISADFYAYLFQFHVKKMKEQEFDIFTLTIFQRPVSTFWNQPLKLLSKSWVMILHQSMLFNVGQISCTFIFCKHIFKSIVRPLTDFWIPDSSISKWNAKNGREFRIHLYR